MDNDCDGILSDAEQAAVGCTADLNGDALVTVADILLLLGDFGCETGCTQDINGDGLVTVSDILVVLGEFGAIC